MKWVTKAPLFIGVLIIFGVSAVNYYQQYELHAETTRLKLLAEKGDADAQYEYGRRIYYGWGADENKSLALKWYRKSAEQGDSNGEFCLGNSQAPDSINWFIKSAEQDNQFAEYRLGLIYESGDGIPKNNELAYFWFKLAERHPYFGKGNMGNKSDEIRKKIDEKQIIEMQKRLFEWKPIHIVQNKISVC